MYCKNIINEETFTKYKKIKTIIRLETFNFKSIMQLNIKVFIEKKVLTLFKFLVTLVT